MAKDTDTRQRIIIAATELFMKESYEKVSMDSVAARAGVSKGGLFHHFHSKYELGRECLANGLHEMWAEEFMQKASRIKKPENRVKLFIDSTVHEFGANHKFLMLMVDVYEESLKRREDMKMWREIYTEYTAMTERLIADCGVPNPKEKARLLMAALDGLTVQMMLMGDDPKSPGMARVKKEMLRMVLEPAPVAQKKARQGK